MRELVYNRCLPNLKKKHLFGTLVVLPSMVKTTVSVTSLNWLTGPSSQPRSPNNLNYNTNYQKSLIDSEGVFHPFYLGINS